MGIEEKYRGKKPLTSQTLQRIHNLGPLCERHGLRFAYVFGSAARATAEAASCHDIDLAVMPGGTFSFRPFYADVSRLLQTDRLDIVDMRYAPISLLFSIIETNHLLYTAPKGKTRRHLCVSFAASFVILWCGHTTVSSFSRRAWHHDITA